MSGCFHQARAAWWKQLGAVKQAPAVPYSWFPFLGTRDNHTWGSRATKNLQITSSYTPPDKGKQRIVHALCSLNEATVKRQTTYEDLRMLKSVVKPQDFMLAQLACGKCILSRPDPPQASEGSSSPATWRCRSLSRTSLSSYNQEVTLSVQDQTSRHQCPRL